MMIVAIVLTEFVLQNQFASAPKIYRGLINYSDISDTETPFSHREIIPVI